MIRLFVIFMLMMGSVHAASFRVASDGPVNAFYAGSSAGYESNFFALIGPVDHMIVADVFSNKSANIGDFKHLGDFESGDSFLPFLNVLTTGYFYGSTPASNLDGLNHIFASQFSLSDGTPAVFIGFEDIYGLGDRDFNDNMVIFTNVMMAPVPEPSTYAMLLVGLGLIGFAARTRVKARRKYLDSLIAGAIYDFMGFLTTKDGTLKLGRTHDAAPAANAVVEFLELRGVSDEVSPMVETWNDMR